jgi:hypothetical protein
MLEHAHAVGEKLAAMEHQKSKLTDLEEHLDSEAAKFYSDEAPKDK